MDKACSAVLSLSSQLGVGVMVGVVLYWALAVGVEVGMAVGGNVGISGGQELHVLGQFLRTPGP